MTLSSKMMAEICGFEMILKCLELFRKLWNDG